MKIGAQVEIASVHLRERRRGGSTAGEEDRLVGEVGMIAEELQAAGVVRGDQHLQSIRGRTSRDSTLTGKR